jgi:pectate lyase-like protein
VKPTLLRWGAVVAAVLAAAVIGALVARESSDTPDGWVNVKEHGVKGDGKSDDRAAIQKVLDDEPAGTTLLFPPGTYDIKGGLHVDKPMVLYGHGATLRASAGMPYMLRYSSGARRAVGVGVQGLSFDMNNGPLRNRVRRGFEVRDSWHSVHDVRIFNAHAATGVYVGPLKDKSDVVGTYYNEIRVMAEGGPLYGDPGGIGVHLEGPRPENASNANVIIGRVENFETGVEVGPNTAANVLRELDTTGCSIGMNLISGRTLGYGLWAEENRVQDVVVRSGAKARLDFQHYQKRPRVDGGGELRLYP